MTDARSRIVLSVDLDEWYHSRRWVDGRQAAAIPTTRDVCRAVYGTDRPPGEIVAPTRALLALLDTHRVAATFFVLGEVAELYPDLVREIAARGHEIATHGLVHADMTLLGPDRFARDLDASLRILERLSGAAPIGYRAPNLVYEPWATRVLEQHGILYDASVCASRPLGGKYKGWVDAPTTPYHPAYENVARCGDARLLELPLPSFPMIRIAAGSSITTRVFGYHWSRIALWSALRAGDTSYYLHPWELGARPQVTDHRIRNAVFLRRTGAWMRRALDRLLDEFTGRFVCGRDVVRAPRGDRPVPPLGAAALASDAHDRSR
jgi:peptidoglycan/xylan/chitin deacetylase (PgdA/CDA1 family)